jgi:hypothetical protein
MTLQPFLLAQLGRRDLAGEKRPHLCGGQTRLGSQALHGIEQLRFPLRIRHRHGTGLFDLRHLIHPARRSTIKAGKSPPAEEEDVPEVMQPVKINPRAPLRPNKTRKKEDALSMR